MHGVDNLHVIGHVYQPHLCNTEPHPHLLRLTRSTLGENLLDDIVDAVELAGYCTTNVCGRKLVEEFGGGEGGVSGGEGVVTLTATGGTGEAHITGGA